jgi:spore coat polysaccharide biosynthesis protein SpsF (cytidylyltransferase family)
MVIGIIQARLGSTRLPGKILAPIAGRPMLELIANRVRRSRVEKWWLATSTDPGDDVTESWGHSLGLQVFRGESDNVLSRFTAIIRESDPEWIVRVTADNPFISGEAVDLLLDARAAFGKGHPVDTFDDLAMARSAFALFEANAPGCASSIRYPEMVSLLDPHPEIVGQNEGVEQKQLGEG